MEATRGKTVAIVQSCYLPWKGYFDLVAGADEFVLYDDRQFTRRDWRNRNRVKTAQGVQWLTVPVVVKGRYHQRIDETEVADREWPDTHWETLRHAYRGAPCFDEVAPALEELLRGRRELLLSDVNRALLRGLCDLLGIRTTLTAATDYEVTGERTERLVALCRAAGAQTYLSGPAARAYLDEALFADAGIAVRWMDYEGYPEYPQLHPPFDHHVSIVDLLFNTGAVAPAFMKAVPSAA